jgi:oligopeptide/dipeptide ABC transporter ATP-binding protein
VEHLVNKPESGPASGEDVKPLLEVEDLHVHFIRGKSAVRAVDGVSFHVMPGETLGIVGESGSGKSMTGLAILRLVPSPGKIVRGSIRYKGRDLASLPEREVRRLRGKEISMVLQDPQSSLNPLFTIGNQVEEAYALHAGPGREAQGSSRGRSAISDLAIRALEMVRISDPRQRMRQYPHQLSGGMKQRVVSAISMAGNPDLLIADEPTTALDATTQLQYMELLQELQARHGMSIIFITHDLGLVAHMCDRVAVMYAGEIVETAETRVLFDRSAHPYTEALLKSVPRLEEKVDRLYSIPGRALSRVDGTITGCRFANRCPYKTDRCTVEKPELEKVGEGQYARCWHPIHG